jgi:multidrug efflux system membrane fusion protein
MKGFIWTVLLLAAGGGGLWYYTRPAPEPVADAATRGRAAIPVVIAMAETRDVPIYMDGLGTVQASANVTIKPMVDGPLLEVRFREGQDVKAGDVLARIDPRQYQASLDQTSARKRQDEATLANARLDLARYQKLAATAYTSAQQADTQKSLVAQLEAQVAQDQAQIDNARTQLGYTTIVAPVDGRLGIRTVDAGNIVRASDPNGLVVVTTLKPINVQFTLPQQGLAGVAAAMAAGAPEVLALTQGGGRGEAERGVLTVLDNVVDPATGTIKLKASFANDNLRLWPGAFVTVRLRVETRRAAVVVPPVAVQRGPRGPYVFVVGDGTVSRRAVTVGHEDLTVAVIAEGLAVGERVVVDGAARLSDGSRITILPAAGAPGTGAAPPPAGQRARRPGTPG